MRPIPSWTDADGNMGRTIQRGCRSGGTLSPNVTDAARESVAEEKKTMREEEKREKKGAAERGREV